jgi:hypothetical protein
VAGGEFSAAGGIPVHNVARWVPGGWIALGDGFDATVRALAILDGALVAAGDFTHSGSVPIAHVARWNGSALATAGYGYGWARAGARRAGRASSCTRAAHSRQRAVSKPIRWRAGWAVLAPLGNGLDGTVHTLAIFNGSLVAGGEFVMREAVSPGQNLARFSSGEWRTPALGLDGPIYASAIYRGALVVGGRSRTSIS